MMQKSVSYSGIVVVVVVIMFLAACGSEVNEDVAEQADQHTEHQTAEHSTEEAAHRHDNAKTGQIEQEFCPVMGNPINPEIYTMHEGEKIYFCCPGCIGRFNANPEKYSS